MVKKEKKTQKGEEGKEGVGKGEGGGRERKEGGIEG